MAEKGRERWRDIVIEEKTERKRKWRQIWSYRAIHFEKITYITRKPQR